MALHFKLNPLFDSISGTISRKRLPDGRVETIVATKRIRKACPPVAVKSFPAHGRVMVASLVARTKHMTITGPCPENQTPKTKAQHGKSIF